MRVMPKPALQGAVALGTWNVLGAAVLFARNVILARMLGPEAFGIAASFALLLTMAEMATGLGIDRFMIQVRKGASARTQAAMHGLQLARGGVGAILILCAAVPTASLLGAPHAWSSYSLLAIVPLLRGAVHLDMVRAQRLSRFGGLIGAQVVSMLTMLALLYPCMHVLGDHRAMLAALLIQHFGMTVASHLLSRRRYCILWDRLLALQAWRFGLPVLANGVVLFLCLQADQMLVGAFFGAGVLGWFAVAWSLAVMPSMVLAASLQSVLLPMAARQRAHESTQTRALVMVSCTVAALIYAIVGSLVAPLALVSVFGPAYAAGAGILPILCLAQALRLLKTGPAILALAEGRTRVILLANIPRLLVIPVGALLLAEGGGVSALVMTGLVGEAVSVLCAFTLSQRIKAPVLKRGAVHV